MTSPENQTLLLPQAADRTLGFEESLIRSTTRKAQPYKAINLGQGTPDASPPEEILLALKENILKPENFQYTNTWGIKSFREAIAKKYSKSLGREIDSDTEITVTCGSTEGMNDALNAFVNPGDEVIMFEPFYDNYNPNIKMTGGVAVYVKLNQKNNWSFDLKELENAFTNKTKAIIVNTPHNPSGKVFNLQELQEIAKLCKKYNVLAITDEIYEHIVYEGNKHISLASLDGMQDRTIVITGLSKTYNVTGLRIGYVIAKPYLTEAIRKIHDFTTVCLSTAYQKLGEAAMNMDSSYYDGLLDSYSVKRKLIVDALNEIGLPAYKPDGSYFILTDIKKHADKLGIDNDLDFTDYLIKEIGVAVVPGSNFFANPSDGKNLIRISFCKNTETLKAAIDRLKKL